MQYIVKQRRSSTNKLTNMKGEGKKWESFSPTKINRNREIVRLVVYLYRLSTTYQIFSWYHLIRSFPISSFRTLEPKSRAPMLRRLKGDIVWQSSTTNGNQRINPISIRSTSCLEKPLPRASTNTTNCANRSYLSII